MSKVARNFNGFHYHIIEKPFYNEFLYKIQFRGPDVHTSAWENSIALKKHELYELQKYRRLHGIIRDRARELSGSRSFRFRQDSGLCVYVHDLNIAKTLANEFQYHVLSIWGPMDDRHKQYALLHSKVRTKSTLWKGKFRYKIVLRLTNLDNESLTRILETLVLGEDYEMSRSLEDILTIGKMQTKIPRYFAWNSGENVLYSSDEGLIMMISLSLPDAIHRIDKVITHYELSQQETITEENAGTKPSKQA